MSLATRCTACGTVFRVVQDQLKVSEGWVRCGRCDEVFNALEGLFDLERDEPPQWNPPAAPPVAAVAPPPAAPSTGAKAPPAAQPPAPAPSFQPEPPDDDDIFQLSEEDRIHSRFFHPEQPDVAQTPAQSVAQRDRVDFSDAQFNMDLLESEAGGPREPVRKSKPAAKTPARKAPAAKAPARPAAPPKPAAPGFVREARQRERWRSPWVRGLLSLCVLGLLAGLAGQAAFHFRDTVAAQWPETRPWLAAACRQWHCELGAPRRIDDVVVESSALAPANGGAAYKLSVVMRNRGALALAMPSVDLSLSDPNGQLVSRRALSPADFNVAAPVLAAGSETPLQVIFSTDGRRVSGYTVEIFYP